MMEETQGSPTPHCWTISHGEIWGGASHFLQLCTSSDPTGLWKTMTIQWSSRWPWLNQVGHTMALGKVWRRKGIDMEESGGIGRRGRRWREHTEDQAIKASLGRRIVTSDNNFFRLKSYNEKCLCSELHQMALETSGFGLPDTDKEWQHSSFQEAANTC